MSETKQLNVTFEFQTGKGTWMALGAAGAVLVAAILVAVTMGIGWATFEQSVSGNGVQQAGDATYGLFEVSGDGGSTKYSNDGLDDADGIGLMRAAGPLAIVGLVLGFLATATLAASLFLRTFRLTLVGSAVAALAAVFMILTVVLFPIGLADFHEAGSSQGGGFTVEASDLTWGAGLILAAVGTVLALGAAMTGFLSLRDPSLT